VRPTYQALTLLGKTAVKMVPSADAHPFGAVRALCTCHIAEARGIVGLVLSCAAFSISMIVRGLCSVIEVRSQRGRNGWQAPRRTGRQGLTQIRQHNAYSVGSDQRTYPANRRSTSGTGRACARRIEFRRVGMESGPHAKQKELHAEAESSNQRGDSGT
jgi:hypothetical protein